MLTIGQVLAQLGRIASPDKAAGWDPVGLQLGDPSKQAESVAVCHEATEDVVAWAEEARPSLIVSYHPLLFRPTTSITAGRSPAGRALRLLRIGAALAVVHTDFDVAKGGTADALADALGLTNPAPFGPVAGAEAVKIVTFVPEAAVDEVRAGLAAAGAGEIGAYTHCSFTVRGEGSFFPGPETQPAVGSRGVLNREPEVRLEMVAPRRRREAIVAALVATHPYEEPAYDLVATESNSGLIGRVGPVSDVDTHADLVELVAARLGGVIRQFGPRGSVANVAVVPGAGADFIQSAHRAGADVLVTGDVGHHRAVEAVDLGLGLIDPGHAATERPGMAALYAAVRSVTTDAVDLTHLDPTPWSPA